MERSNHVYGNWSLSSWWRAFSPVVSTSYASFIYFFLYHDFYFLFFFFFVAFSFPTITSLNIVSGCPSAATVFELEVIDTHHKVENYLRLIDNESWEIIVFGDENRNNLAEDSSTSVEIKPIDVMSMYSLLENLPK